MRLIMTGVNMKVVKRSDRGFSLIELMVSVALGLIILTALFIIFVGNIRSRGEIEKASQQIENGRYAIQLLTEDLRLAGFFAEFDPSLMASPAALPDVCAAGINDLKSSFMLHVQGHNNGAVTPSCVKDLKADTDIVVVRRASTCVAGTAGCQEVAGAPHFQASLCSNASELENPTYLDHHFKLSYATADLTLTKRNCTAPAAYSRYRTHVYFIANNNVSGDGIPTLKRAELDVGGFGKDPVPLVEGIEDLQIEYGLDKPTVDGAPDSYTAAPASIEDWRTVVSVKIGLLARNTEKTQGYTDPKTYTLLSNAATSYSDGYKRHAFQSTVRLNNPSGRRTP
jgi:type IV pilus assembly protein PilW